MSRRNDPSEPQWYRHQHVPSMLLEIPIRDLPAVVGCLVLGTLYGLKEDVLPQETGTELVGAAWGLRGKIPADLLRAMMGMDEIDWYGSFPKDERRAQYIDRLIARVSAVLRDLADTNYDLRWVIESDPLARDEEFSSPKLNPYYESVAEETVLRRMANACRRGHRLPRTHVRPESVGWATSRQAILGLPTVNPDEVRHHLQSLRDAGYLETSPDGKRWRPTESGWEKIARLEEQNR